MQQLHPASPSIHSIQDDDDNNEQQDVHSIHHSGPLTRADLSTTGSNHRNLADGEKFRERQKAELVDLRSQILELKQYHSTRIDQVRLSLSPTHAILRTYLKRYNGSSVSIKI